MVFWQMLDDQEENRCQVHGYIGPVLWDEYERLVNTPRGAWDITHAPISHSETHDSVRRSIVRREAQQAPMLQKHAMFTLLKGQCLISRSFLRSV